MNIHALLLTPENFEQKSLYMLSSIVSRLSNPLNHDTTKIGLDSALNSADITVMAKING